MIEVTGKYALESDGERNYIILRKNVSKKDGKVTWINAAYHQSLGDALYCILRKETKGFAAKKDGKTLRALADEMRVFERQLMEELLEKAGAL